MRKALLGTTALVAGSVVGAAATPSEAADPISLSLGGYYQVFVVGRSQDRVNGMEQQHPVDVQQEGEVWFTGETTLDNGIRVGVNIQLEAEDSADQIDEHFVYFVGDFGRINAGAENSSAYLMQYSAPSGATGLGVNSPNHALFEEPTANSAPTASFVNTTSDANKLTYFTPRFAPGFQFGFSYTPDISEVPRGGGASIQSNMDSGVVVDNLFAFGVNFVRTVGGIDVAWAGGLEGGFQEERGDSAGEGFDRSDDWAYSVSTGFNLGIGGFTVGGSGIYQNTAESSDGFLVGLNEKESWFADLGVTYGIGPWLVGLAGGYGMGEDDAPEVGNNFVRGEDIDTDLLNGDDERLLVELGATYTLGPGIRIVGAAQYIYMDGDNENPALGNNDGEDMTGVGFAIGTALSF